MGSKGEAGQVAASVAAIAASQGVRAGGGSDRF